MDRTDEDRAARPAAESLALAVNAVLHVGLDAEEPCVTACTHVVVGQWTALGIANVVRRAAPAEARLRRDSGHCLILAERQRQISEEGWTPEHDDHHAGNQMYYAAVEYLRAGAPDAKVTNLWPWERKWWKPKDRLSNLVRAGALLLAEQERIARRRTGTGRPWPETVEIPFLLDGIALEIGHLNA